MSTARTPYPDAITDGEWAFAAPYPALPREDAPPRERDLREVLGALRGLAKAGCSWRRLPHVFPPRAGVADLCRVRI